MADQRDYYQILQISPKADPAIVKAAYYTQLKVMKKHPDLGGSHEEAILLNEAYAVLSDPSRRKEYDRKYGAPAVRTSRETFSPATEQRRAVRLFFQQKFKFRKDGGEWIDAQFQDISLLGACLRSLAKFRSGEKLELDISDEPLVRATAVVRWARFIPQRFGTPLYEGGIEFEKINAVAFKAFLKKSGLANLL